MQSQALNASGFHGTLFTNTSICQTATPHVYRSFLICGGIVFFDDIIHTRATSSYQFLLLHLSLSFASRVSCLARLHLQALEQASKFGCPYSLVI